MYVFMLIFGVLLWVTVGLIFLRRPCASAFHPLTFMLFFQFLIFVLRPILAYQQSFDGIYAAYDFAPSEATKIRALIVADIGFAMFSMVVMAVGRLPMVVRTPPMSAAIAARAFKAFFISAILCAPVSLLSLRASISERSNSSSTMIMDAATGMTVNTTANGYFSSASIMLAAVTVVFAWLNRFRWWSLLPFVLYVVFKGASGGRFPFVMATGSLLLFYLWEKRQRWANLRSIGVGVAVILFFGAVGADRGAAMRSLLFNDRPMEQTDAFAERPLESMDYGNMEFLEYIVQTVPAKTGTYDYFLDNLILLTGPIPRVLWPGKPIGSPIKRFYLFNYGNPIGMTNSMAGEGWMAMGWLGVLLWSGLTGVVLGKLYTWFVLSRQSIYQVALYIMFVPLSLLFFRDGSLPEIVTIVAFQLMPVFLWKLASRFTEPAAKAPARAPGGPGR